MGKIVNQDLPVDPPAPSAGSHVIYTKAGGVFVRGPSGVVGPLSAGGSVNDLQDAYDGGNAITVVAGTSVSITGAATGDALRASSAGSGSAIYAEKAVGSTGNAIKTYGYPTTTNDVISSTSGGGGSAVYAEIAVGSTGHALKTYGYPATTTDVISSTSDGSGSAVYAETTGTGNGLTVYALPGSTGKGVSSLMAGTGPAVFAEKSGTGNGIEVKMISPATGSGLKVESATTLATFPGIAVDHAGDAVGVLATMTNAVNATGFSTVVSAVGPFSAGVRVELLGGAAAGSGLSISMQSTATGNAIKVQNPDVPATVFTVDNVGNTTTPSVIFGGSRITVEGDSGVAGDPVNPRVSLTSGSVNVGALVRVYDAPVSIGLADLDLDGISGYPTVFTVAVTGANNVLLPKSGKYPSGTEICVINTSTATFFDAYSGLVPPPVSIDPQQYIYDFSGALVANQGIGTNSMAKFMSRGSSGWVRTA